MNSPTNIDFGSLVIADPFRCRVWGLNDRLERYITVASCRAEIESIQRDGQLVAAIGRTLDGDPDFDIEVICGGRRLFVARHLKIPLRVTIRELTDRQAAVAIQAENFMHKQTSPYERGLWLSKLLRQNLYRSQDEMACELGITPARLSRLLKFADLPAIVLDAFASPQDILESWAVELHKACSDERHRLLADRARALEKLVPRPPAVSVYAMLMASRGHPIRGCRRSVGPELKDPSGTPLLRFERQRENVVLRIPGALVDATTEMEVTEAVLNILKRAAPTEAAASVT